MTAPLTSRLRHETQAAHQALEDQLDLLAPPLVAARFRAALLGFHGFHAAWEPAVAAEPGVAALFEGRSRLAHLRRDLAALGVGDLQVAHAPRCDAAAALARDTPAALGSLYVMEGSTLGGQLIARAVQGCGWLPEGGLTYFTAHGAATGLKWRTLQQRLDAAPAEDGDRVVAGAQAAFSLLRDWMADRLTP